MLLSNLSSVINIVKTYNYKSDTYFSSITSNSKLTNKNTIFIIDKNNKTNNAYLKEAIKNKTPAIISNKYNRSVSIPQFIVSKLNSEIEILLKNIYKKYPYKSIAITGTNGKTSVVWYICKILSKMKYSNSSLGTLGYYRNGVKIKETTLTTPAFEELFKYGNFKSNKKNIFVFEASSHALNQNRLRNYPINIAAITNISKDHLDYHKNMYEYRNSKLKLFTKHLSNNGYAIINSRIKNLSKIKNNLLQKKIKIITYGKKNIYFKKTNDKLKLNINKKVYDLKNFKLNSVIELENLECAISCCLALNIKKDIIVKTLSALNNPPGRLQILKYNKTKSQIIIDYAHTPDALKKILISNKKSNKKPNLLFGCGGNRDKSKRKEMGIIANKYASKVYITDDNPRNENASKIRKTILKYCPFGIEIPDRKKAIKIALKNLNFNEVLIIAGKGHEKIQIIKNKKLKFDDYAIVKNIINNDK